MKFYGTDDLLTLLPLADGMLEALTPLQLTESLAPLTWFVERAADGDGIKLAPSGRLGRAAVQAGDARFGFSKLASIGRKAQNEDDVPALVELRMLTRVLGLTRTRTGFIVATAAGRRELDATSPADLRDRFRRACAALCPNDNFEDELVSLLLVLLVDCGPDGAGGSALNQELAAMLAQRWRLAGVGEHDRHGWGIAREASHARARLRALGLLTPDQPRRFHVALTEEAGLTGALLALNARLEQAHDNAGPPSSSGLIAWAMEQGFDPTDQRSLDAAQQRFNALSYEERGRILGLE